jgi:hypothetical protein
MGPIGSRSANVVNRPAGIQVFRHGHVTVIA